jgi:small subunit ribosomal protein S6
MPNPYELLYIIPGTQTEEEAQQSSQAVRQLLRDRGATIVKEDWWGKRRLAYEIEHVRQGYYDLIEFDLEPAKLSELEQAIRLHEHVLRHQVVRRIVLTPEQQAAVQARRERIAARRQAEKEKETVAAMTAEAPTTAAPVEPQAAISEQELEEKLEEILDEKKIDV